MCPGAHRISLQDPLFTHSTYEADRLPASLEMGKLRLKMLVVSESTKKQTKD